MWCQITNYNNLLLCKPFSQFFSNLYTWYSLWMCALFIFFMIEIKQKLSLKKNRQRKHDLFLIKKKKKNQTDL